MEEITKFNLHLGPPTDEQLHINLAKGKIDGLLHALKFVDKSTLQHVAYIPSLELSGYGETEAQALEMLKFSLDDFGSYMSKLSQRKINEELVKLGWQKTMFNKDFSKAYIDINGQLQNFNAVDNKVEILTLQTA